MSPTDEAAVARIVASEIEQNQVPGDSPLLRIWFDSAISTIRSCWNRNWTAHPELVEKSKSSFGASVAEDTWRTSCLEFAVKGIGENVRKMEREIGLNGA